jgi:hypothetical protein
MTDELAVTDMLGNAYRVGDHVVYGTISGKSPVLKYAVVEKIVEEERERVTGYEPYTSPNGYQGHRPTYEKYTYYKVGVREIKNGRNFTRWDTRGAWDPETRTYGPGKPARITYPMTENIVKAIPNTEREKA